MLNSPYFAFSSDTSIRTVADWAQTMHATNKALKIEIESVKFDVRYYLPSIYVLL